MAQQFKTLDHSASCGYAEGAGRRDAYRPSSPAYSPTELTTFEHRNQNVRVCVCV